MTFTAPINQPPTWVLEIISILLIMLAIRGAWKLSRFLADLVFFHFVSARRAHGSWAARYFLGYALHPDLATARRQARRNHWRRLGWRTP